MAKKKEIDLREFVYNYKTKYKEGFLPDELKDVISKFPKINMKKYNDAMFGNTCSMREGKLVIYHCDVLKALRCGIENRDLTVEEFD